MADKTVFRAGGDNYTREDLFRLEPTALRALFRERVHHGIEVKLYPAILEERRVPADFGYEASMILDVWLERGLSVEGPDFEWGKQYISLASRMAAGEEVTLADLPAPPEPFTLGELKTVEKLIWERRSIRDWKEKEIPDDVIEKVLEAGRAAPLGCNLAVVRYVVLRTAKELATMSSDVRTPAGRCVVVVIGYDSRIYPAVGHDKFVPHNQVLDCAAAGDHMLLMASALGLGGVWLTQTEKTARSFKEKSGVPEYFEPVLHIALGWPSTGTMKTQRPPLGDMIIETSIG